MMAGLLLLVSSCADDNLKPILTFDQVTKGGYVRLVSLTTGEYDLQNYNSTAYQYSVEFVDLEQGALITQYDLNVSFTDNHGGGTSGGPVLYRSWSAGDFGTNANGFKNLDDITIPITEVAALFGLSEADFVAGDVFTFEGSVTLSDGNVYSFDNSSAAVNGSAFQGWFKFTAKVTCPLDNSVFTGDYMLSYDDDSDLDEGFGESLVKEVVTLRTVSGSSTQRAFDCTYLAVFGGFGVTVTMDFVCVSLDFLESNTGVGCGNDIILRPTGTSRPVDINDPNATLLLDYIEDLGDCNVGTPLRKMRLTKQ